MAAEHLELVGLHSHIGSQILSLDAFAAAAEAILALRAEASKTFGVTIPEIDFGGGHIDLRLDPSIVKPPRLNEVQPEQPDLLGMRIQALLCLELGVVRLPHVKDHLPGRLPHAPKHRRARLDYRAHVVHGHRLQGLRDV